MQETQERDMGSIPVWVGKTPWRRKMVTDFSILAWRIPWTEEPGGLQSMVLQRVGYAWATSLSLSLSSRKD